MLDGLFQLPDGVGVTKQIVWRAVGDGGVPADTQLQVLDQASPRGPAGDVGQGPVGHGVGEKARPQPAIGAFQNRSSTYGLEVVLSIDRAVFDEVLVELEAKARPVGHGKTTVRVNPRSVDEDLAQGGCRPPRGVVRELEP